jgi:hypothetical protein
MQYEIQRNRTLQLASLLLTAVIIGAGLALALSAG